MAKNRIFKGTKVKAPANAPNSVVLQNIDVRPIHRRSQDVTNWRNAMQIAESRVPRRATLYDLYFDTVLDDQVLAVWGKRTDAITTANWQFVDKEGKPVDTINEIIDSIGFDEMLAEIMNAKAWGYSMFEPKFFKNSSGRLEVSPNLIPRLNMRPEAGVIAYDVTGDEGYNVRQGYYSKTIMEVGKTTDLGLLLSASMYAILKRGSVGDYAMFVQVFGTPAVDATWDGFDEKQRAQLLQAIQDMGAGGVLVRPEGTNVTLLENKNAGKEPHDGFISKMDKAIAKCLLGTTETTESSDSSGYAQSKTHQDQDNVKHNADLAFVRKTLNSRFLKILETHGIETMGGSFIIQGEETELSKKESFEMHRTMVKELGLPVDDDFWYETYGLPKPDDYEARKAKIEEETDKKNQSLQKETPEPLIKPKKTKEKDQEQEVKLNFFEKLFKLSFSTASTETIGATKTSCCGNHHMIKLTNNELSNNSELIKRVYDAKGKLEFDFDVFQQTTNTLLKGFNKGFKKENVNLAFNTGFQYEIDDPALLTAFEQNIFRFAGVKSLALTQELNQLFKNSNSFEEFYQKALTKTEVYNKTWLESEYNTSLLTGEAAATYHRLIKQAKIFPYWEYKVVGDDRVRPEHRLLDGLILPATDPRWKKLFPPNGWNCRCYVVPRLPHEFDKSQLGKMRERADRYLSSKQFKKEIAQGWGVNRALSGEVFTANQQYINKHPNSSFKGIHQLGAVNFSLQSYSNAKKVATANFPVYSNTADAFYNGLEKHEGTNIVRDLLNRPITITEKSYKLHVNKKDNRVLLLNAMQDAIKSPDEIWLRGKDLNEKVYIKYYKDKTLVVMTGEDHLQLELRTWFTLNEKKREINNWRKGLLIQSKK